MVFTFWHFNSSDCLCRRTHTQTHTSSTFPIEYKVLIPYVLCPTKSSTRDSMQKSYENRATKEKVQTKAKKKKQN